jgi:hypothetical protein
MAPRKKAPDAFDKVKSVFKNILSNKKKSKKEQATPAAAAPADASSAATPTETTTAAEPAPAPAPETAPAASKSDAPAAPAPAPAPAGGSPIPVAAEDDNMKAEQAALTEVKKATQSRSSPSFIFYGQNCDDGSRRRYKVGTDSIHS